MTEREKTYPAKIGYRTISGVEARAYTDQYFPLDWEPSDGDVVTGIDKHTDEPMAARWVDDHLGGGEWIEGV